MGPPDSLLQLFCWVGKGGRSQKADAEVQLLRVAAADGAREGMKLLGVRGEHTKGRFRCPEMMGLLGAGGSGGSKGKWRAEN